MHVEWNRLEDAHGTAGEVPELLETIATAKGRKAARAWDDLWSRVLHQGTIYSASPHVAASLIAMLPDANPEARAMAYEMLAGFAEAARQAIRDGRAIPCHAGGDPEHGRAIRDHILGGSQRFNGDLDSSEPRIRSAAAELLTAFPECAPAQPVRDRYLREQEHEVRGAMLTGLCRLGSAVADWPGLLDVALQRECTPENRFTVLHAMAVSGRHDPETFRQLVTELSGMWGDCPACGMGDTRFVEFARSLGTEGERALLLSALEACKSSDLARVLAERLLRLIFGDARAGWQDISYSYEPEGGAGQVRGPVRQMGGMAFRALGMVLLMKLCPPLWRWTMRRPRKGTRVVEYWGLTGDAPALPADLSSAQREVLRALSAKPELWGFRTNLWQAFGLPDTAAALREFASR